MTVSPRGFNSNSVSPRGFNCLSVSPRGFNSFLIALMLMISLPIFSQTEGKYEVVISKGAKINFSNGFNVTKTQLYPGFRMYDITPVFPFSLNNANNGLSISGSNVQLGGTLVQATNINQNGFNFSTNGVGNFGIGTSTPLQKLHVNGAVQFQNALMPNGNAGLIGQVLVSQGAATVPIWQTLASGWGLLGNAGTAQATNFIGTTDNIGLSFRTNNTIRQTITNNGNIGIGLISPLVDFHIRKATTGQVGALVENVNIAATDYTDIATLNGDVKTTLGSYKAGGYGYTGTESNHDFFIYSNNITGFIMKPNGRIGVGTTAAVNNPTNTFFIGNATGSGLTFQNLTSSSAINTTASPIGVTATGEVVRVSPTWNLLGNDGTNQATNFLGTTDNIGLSFRTNNIIRQTINNTGEIGIGTITPTSTLHVIGSVAETVTVITATTSLNATHNKIVLNNGAANIVITLPDALTCIGRKYEFTRYAGSTGAVGITPAAGQIQALAGTLGATTSIGSHNGAGAGLNHTFTAVNIGGVGVWVRL